MKTTNQHTRAIGMATVLCAVIAFGANVWAQSDAGSNTIEDEVYNRLETLMAGTENALKYVAISIDDSEIKEAFEQLELLADETEKAIRYEATSSVTAEYDEAVERLEMLAGHIENEIMYRVCDEGQTDAVEYVAEENNRENETRSALAFYLAYLSNKIRK